MDAHIYSYAMMGDPGVISVLQEADIIGICSISIGELLSGSKGGNRELKNRKELENFLDAPRIQIYSMDATTADYYAEVLNGLKKQGTPIPTNDIWIASTAFQHGLKLFSKDQHFQNIPGLIRAPSSDESGSP
jgi:tRNA(fMet)-specific endonuclease VapC